MTVGEQDELVEVWSRLQTLVLGNNARVEVTEALGLSFVKVRALRRLLPGPLAMHELATAMVTEKPYVTQIVDSLEKLDLVVRSVSAEDRRRRIVTLTESGRAVAERADAILMRPPAVLAALSPADRATLHRILSTLPSN
ncbi:MarR family winged helix-turn-helix transcriptional regulator [Embleya sp. AB8]|uniref:MarR family winged helix-turn-helix transcriptional regulator n=1 Tax=Embleya sp. AB8 TaxID=3156304 RepID=UPI003C735DC3